MARTNNLSNFLTDVANAIRTKKGTNATILASDFDTEIENLPSGGGADLDEYFVTEINETKNQLDPIKKCADLIVGDNITTLANLFNTYTGTKLPKVICNNNITNMDSMYNQCANLTGILDVSGLNTSNVINMYQMFRSLCTNSTKRCTIDISNFDTTNVDNMSRMFTGSYYLTVIGLEHINTSNVINMSAMFHSYCQYMDKTLNLTNFDTRKVTDMSAMFRSNYLPTALDLSSFETPLLTNVEEMFRDCKALQHLDIRKMTFDNVTSYNSMFMNVPNNCEIIVKSQTEKDWITSKFSNLTNVKTVAEYEAEQNA